MAIVLTTPTTNIIPVWSNKWIKMYDNVNFANPKLYYEVKVIIDGTSSDFNIAADRNGYGNIEICNIMQNFITSEIDAHISFLKATELLKSARIEVTSKGIPTSMTEIYECYFWNATNDNYDSFYNDYNIFNGKSKFITNVNNSIIRLNDLQYIHFIRGVYTINNVANKQIQTPFTTLKITNYYKNGTKVEKTLTMPAMDWAVKRIMSINISPTALNFQVPGLNISYDTIYYTIEDTNGQWEPIKINIEGYDSFIANAITFYFVNNCGTTQTANFVKTTNLDYAVKRTQYESNGIYKTYNATVDRGFSTYSGYLNEEASRNLIYLFISPLVQVIDRGIYKNVLIKDKTYKVLTRRNSGLMQYEIEWDYACPYEIQKY